MLLAAMLVIQGCGIQRRIRKADRKAEIGEYYQAGEEYRQIYKKIKKTDKVQRAEIAFKEAECYRKINHYRAANAYSQALRYYPDSIKYLRYAQVLHYQGKYADAAKNYQLYLEGHPECYEAQAGYYACQQVSAWKQEPSRYKVALAKEFNARRSSSFSPAFIGEDDAAIMFTSNRSNAKKKDRQLSPVTGTSFGQLYTMTKDAQGKWEAPMLAEGLYNQEGGSKAEEQAETAANDTTSSAGQKQATSELGVCCFTADGKTMYLTYAKAVNGEDRGAQIYVSERASGEWAEPQLVKLFADSTITVGHPSLNHTGDTLYFASDAPGGYGGKDLYFAEFIDGKWGNVTNLGPRVNTAGDEMFPTIRDDGVLFFSSNGHPGYGGLDIYKIERMARPDSISIEDWVKGDTLGSPWVNHVLMYNMGAPFNSNGDDFGITFAPSKNRKLEDAPEEGYFTSNRGDKKGYDQIYSFVLPEMIILVEGTVRDNLGEVVSSGLLRLVGDDGTSTKVTLRHDGTYRLKLQKNVRYAMLATSRGYLNQRQVIHTQGVKDSKTITQDFVLTTLSKPITMDNIFYEFAKWTLTPESETGLNALIKLLNDNPNITIELSAHTDMKGNAEYNKNLSEKRAQSVVQYLIQHGIAADRLTPVGYGKERPVVADKVLHKQYAFIPDGQVLDEEFILSLNEEQQEICNQINRRTEFRVLKTTYGLY